MVDVEELYFDWLLTRLDPDGVSEEVGYLCGLLHACDFLRRVGNDVNRAADGANLRIEFLTEYEELELTPHVTNDFMLEECSWLEMLVALARHLDFLYDGGVEGRFLELIQNLELDSLTHFGHVPSSRDQELVEGTTRDVDENLFDSDGHGGLFPLQNDNHPDQREVEIWEQHAAYFREKLEGVLWTSTS